MALLTRYVDVSRGTNGDGSQGNPWNTLGGPNWVTMNTADEYTVYLSGGVDTTTPTGYVRFDSDQIPLCTKLSLIGNWVGMNVDNPPPGTYVLKQGNASVFEGSLLLLDGMESHLSDLIIDSVNFTGSTHPGNNWSFVTIGKVNSTIPCTLKHCAITERRANTGDTASKYPHTFRATDTSVVYAINCVFRRKTPGSSGNCLTVLRTGNSAGGYKLVLAGCVADNTLGDTATLSPGGGFQNSSGTQTYDCTIHNSISIGKNIAYYLNAVNCIATGTNNMGGTVTNFTTATAAQAAALFVNAVGGNYTAIEPAPAMVLDTGYDASALIGGYTLDAYGNDRNSANAGIAWDRGPTEYGFGAPWTGAHTVTDISQITDPDCIYYGQTVGGRTVQVGDQVSFDTATQTNAWPVDIDSQGFPIVDSGGAYGTDSFKFNMAAGTSGVWEPEPPAYATWLFTIAAQDPDITTTALGAMTDQVAFSQTLTATGTAPMTWDVLAGSLPPGLSLSSAGVLSGTLAGYGAYDFTARVTNALSTDSQQYTGTVAAALPVVLTTSLPAAYDTGAAYSHQLIASGSSPITWTLTGGALPDGITLSTNGLLSGGTTVEPATFSPQFTATNPAGSAVKTLTLQVLEGTPPVSGPGNALGGIPLSVTGQWLITANPIDHYYLGHPVSATGALVTSADEAVARWHNGLPHIDSGAVAIDELAIVSSWISGLPLTAAGKVAVAMASVAYWAGGVPFTSTGRVAVSTA